MIASWQEKNATYRYFVAEKFRSFIRYTKKSNVVVRNETLWSLVHCIFKFCGDFIVGKNGQTDKTLASYWALKDTFAPNAWADGEGLTLQEKR